MKKRDEHISTLQDIHERDTLTKQLGECRRSLSARWRMPPEILTKIFRACISSKSDMQPMLASTLDQHNPPWSLARTCGRWRSVPLATSSLWGSIVMHSSYNDRNKNRDIKRHELKTLSILLRRSRTSPLFISLHSMGPEHNEILDALLTHSNQWQDIDLQGLPYYLSRLAYQTFPNLESAHITCTGLFGDRVFQCRRHFPFL